jgi:hypothetical protein
METLVAAFVSYIYLPAVNSLEGLRWTRFLPALSDLLDRYLLPFTDEKEGTFQCCGSGWFIPDPYFSIPDHASRVKKGPDPESGSA